MIDLAKVWSVIVGIMSLFALFFTLIWYIGVLFPEPSPPQPDGKANICVNARGEVTRGEDWRECFSVDYYRR